ncbi:hypothetical protein ADIARSV_3067 [Arcticibacter svalbardensis MN12-7]|uniref:Uncharacterized protein n=1 Tax=Arcticibacter svalbardensis MN12-7 TaxID=1150600 RepID=R9GPH5_9SPHI|nr:hypothetical protein [Arcticibacter svalbardensis]EOR93727.1 hypothetical protein ADIARSV_3067 [Arcticibacter svalbardensis MN12-7]
MKKNLLFVAILLAGVSFNKANAQNATLTLNLAALQSIKINTVAVNIDFATAADYTNGKSSGAIADQIEIVSTGIFTVSVAASGPLSTGTAINDIPLSALTLTPTLASSSTTIVPTLNVVTTLAPAVPKAFIKSAVGTSNAKFSVNYGISPGVGSVNLLNRPAGAYKTTVTYTIAPN